VQVLNYRRSPAEFERGTVTATEFIPGDRRSRVDGTRYTTDARWRYTVRLARPTRKHPFGYDLVVSDDAIRRLR
jgi:hypothetical protein